MRLTVVMTLFLTVMTGLQAQEQTEDLDAKYGTQLLKPGEKAPDFQLRDTNGELFDLQKILHKGYVLIDFWASWCGDCRKDMPAMQKLSEQYWADGLQCVGVSFDTDSAKWKHAVGNVYRLIGIQVSELKPWKESQVAKDYRVSWLPTMYLLNPDGTVNMATVSIEKLTERLASLKASGLFDPYKITVPKYKGGIPALQKFLVTNLKYPRACQKAGMQARVMVGFSVDTDGSISDINIDSYEDKGSIVPRVNSLTKDERDKIAAQCRQLFEREAMRIVSIMPAWTPGMQGQEKVRVKYHLPVSFKF